MRLVFIQFHSSGFIIVRTGTGRMTRVTGFNGTHNEASNQFNDACLVEYKYRQCRDDAILNAYSPFPNVSSSKHGGYVVATFPPPLRYSLDPRVMQRNAFMPSR